MYSVLLGFYSSLSCLRLKKLCCCQRCCRRGMCTNPQLRFSFADLPDILIRMQTQRIHITPYTASEKCWFLGNDAELHPQILKSNAADIKIINEYSPAVWVDKAEQCTQKRRLLTPSSANNSTPILFLSENVQVIPRRTVGAFGPYLT